MGRPRAPQNPSQLLGVDNDFVQLATRYINEGDASLASIGSLFLCTLFTQPSLLAPDAVSRFLSSSGGLPVYERYDSSTTTRALNLSHNSLIASRRSMS